MHYVRTSQRELNPEESVVVYTDGLEHILNLGQFKSGILNRDISKLKKVSQKEVKTEGTAVVYLPDLREIIQNEPND